MSSILILVAVTIYSILTCTRIPCWDSHCENVSFEVLSLHKWRHQESLWRENLHGDGNPRTTTPTGHEPKELATVSRIEESLGDPYKYYDAQESFGKQDHQVPITEEVKEIGEIGTHSLPDSKKSETSSSQSHMHFDDSVESIADSDLEDGTSQKMLTSPLYAQDASGKPDAMVVQDKEVSAQFTQANRRESLIHLKVRKLWGNPMHCFHLNRWTWSGVLCSETLICRIWEDLFLKVTRITCSIRQDQNWQSKNLMSNLLTKKAQERRISEVSVQKLRENHETMQQLTSQLQQMQELMNSVNDSGDFQDVESNYSGRLSHVSSQLVMIPSSRSMQSRDKRLPLDTWNQSGLQENIFGNLFSTFDSPRDHPQGIHSDATQRRTRISSTSYRASFHKRWQTK